MTQDSMIKLLCLFLKIAYPTIANIYTDIVHFGRLVSLEAINSVSNACFQRQQGFWSIGNTRRLTLMSQFIYRRHHNTVLSNLLKTLDGMMSTGCVLFQRHPRPQSKRFERLKRLVSIAGVTLFLF